MTTPEDQAAIDAYREETLEKLKASRLEVGEEGLKNLAAHKYKSGAYTPIDNMLNTWFWIPLSERLPSWLAPNAVTLIGLVVLAVGCQAQSYFAPDIRAQGPAWSHAVAALSIFLYQTLDAIDGKQARRTGSSSPLGQLFDHGCDSVSTTFLGLMCCTSLHLGFNIRATVFLYTCQCPFWFAQWCEYHTHVLSTCLAGGFAGVTEAQLLMCVFALVNVVDATFWERDLGLFSMPSWYCGQDTCPVAPNDVILLLHVLTAALSVKGSVDGVLAAAKCKSKALQQTIPIWMLVTLGCAWSLLLPQKHPRLVLLSLGMAFSFVTSRMIVAAMSKQEYATVQTVLLPLPIIFVICHFELSPRHNEVILGGYVSFCVYKTYRYIGNVIEELSKYLGIYAFTLGPRASVKTLNKKGKAA